MTSRIEMNQAIIDEFRANAGQVGGYFANIPLVLLHTRGAKSGTERIHPLAYIADGEHVVVTASNGGRDTHPSWYYNILADPNVTVEQGAERYHARAVIAGPAERERLYAKMVARNPGFGDYAQKTSRAIPVVILERTR